MESGSQRAPQKQHPKKQCISDAVGEFIDGPSKRCCCHRWFGQMIQAVGENNTWFVLMMGRKESCHQQCLQWNTWLHISPLNIVIPI